MVYSICIEDIPERLNHQPNRLKDQKEQHAESGYLQLAHVNKEAHEEFYALYKR